MSLNLNSTTPSLHTTDDDARPGNNTSVIRTIFGNVGAAERCPRRTPRLNP